MEKVASRFLGLLEQSTVTSGLVAVLLVGTASYCTIIGQTVPDYFSVAIGIVIGFFFSQKAGTIQLKAQAQLLKGNE